MSIGDDVINRTLEKNKKTKKDLSSELSDQTLETSPNNIKEICTKWKTAISSIDLSSVDVESIFAPLINVGVGTAYFPSLKQAIAKAEKSVNSTSNLVSSAAQEQSDINNQYNNQQNNNNYTGGNCGRRTTTADTPINPDDIPSADDELTDEDLVVNTEFADQISKLDANSYIEFMKSLGSIDGGLLPYLVDTEYATKLKEYLLSAPNISEDLKKIIAEMDENELQVTLLSIVTNESAITDASKSIIYNYTTALSQMDKLKDIKTSQLFLKSVDIVDVLFDKELKSETIQDDLLQVYEGNSVEDLDDFSTNLVKSTIDEICKNNNIDYEMLLTDPNNLEKIKEGIADISKTLSYFKAINSLGDEAAELIYQSLIKSDDKPEVIKDI